MKKKGQIDILEEIVVDLFAGGGGWSTGFELATGRVVNIAVNHDPDAVLMHRIFARMFLRWTRKRRVAAGALDGFMLRQTASIFQRQKGENPLTKESEGLHGSCCAGHWKWSRAF